MNILVTGCNGFIGRECASYFKDSGHTIHLTNRNSLNILNEKEVDNLKKYEKLFNDAKDKCNKVVAAMEQHQETSHSVKSKYNFYGSTHIHDSQTMDNYVAMKCTDLALNNFGKTKEGSAMAKLEKKRVQAVDYIYGMNESSALSQGLSKILKGTKIKLQIGGK